jgi:hypothetical protein
METYPQPNNNRDSENHNQALSQRHSFTKPIASVALLLLGVGIGGVGGYTWQHNSTVASKSPMVKSTSATNPNNQPSGQLVAMTSGNSNYITSIVQEVGPAVSCHAFNLLVEIGQRKQGRQRGTGRINFGGDLQRQPLQSEQDLFLTSKYAV